MTHIFVSNSRTSVQPIKSTPSLSLADQSPIRRQTSKGRSIYGLILIAILSFLPSLAARASEKWTYCYLDSLNHNICLPSLDDAIASWKATLRDPIEIKQTHTEVQSDGTEIIYYSTISLPPETSTPFKYWVPYTTLPINCSGPPWGGCATEEELVQLIEQYYINYAGAGAYTFQLKGSSHDDGYPGLVQMKTNQVYDISYDYPWDQRVLLLTYTANGNTSPVVIAKGKQGTCKAGYGWVGAEVWWGRGFAPPDQKIYEGTWDDLCGGYEMPLITARVAQIDSCPANENPCYPATGDKARFEPDFDFGGRPFVRSYHSVRETSIPWIAPGWWLSYGEHLSFYDIYRKSSVDEKGYLDFYVAAETGVYHSQNHQGRVVRVTPSGYSMEDKDGTRREFDSGGYLTRVIEPSSNNRSVTVTYDPRHRLDKLVDDQGRTVRFTYTEDTAQGRLASATLPDGSNISYGYDANGNLASVQYPDGRSRLYHYSEAGLAASTQVNLLTGITDETGLRYASFSYDNRGRVLSSKLHNGAGFVATTTLSYTSTSTVDVVTPNSDMQRFQFEWFGFSNPLSITADGRSLQMKYLNNQLSQKQDLAGNITTYENSGSYLAARTEALGTTAERRTEYGRDPLGHLLSVKVKAKVSGVLQDQTVTGFTYNGRNQILTSTSTDPASGVSRTKTNTYCEQVYIDAGKCPLLGLVTSIDGPRTDVSDLTSYAYYLSDDPSCVSAPTTCPHHKGDLWKVTNALNQVTQNLKYDGAGRVLSVQDPNGLITDLEYHPRGWLTARKVRGINNAVETDDQITRIDYWPSGLVQKVTQPDGAFTTYTYDTAHRLTDVADGGGNTVHYTLDNAGNRTGEDTKDNQGALRRTLSRVYNQLSQLQTQKDAFNNPTGFTYDANGNSDLVTDALTRVTNNDYDPLNRLSRTLQDAGGIAAQTSFQYDVLDNLTKVTDPKNLDTNYSYNGLGDLLQLSSPDTGTTTYTYDSGGDRKTQLDARSKTTTYGYDALSRLTTISYPTTGLNVTYTYDANQAVCATGETFSKGRLTKLKDASGTTQYCFDRFGNLVRKVQTTNAKVLTVRYAYTLGGRLLSVTYPDGALVDYVRNALGQATEVGVTPAGGTRQVLLTQATYSPFGPVTGWSFGNGRTVQRTFNQNYQPNVIADSQIAGGLSLGYSFDPVGNLAALRTALQTDPPLASYGYDRLNRLSDVRDGPTSTVIEHYDYDPTGNRLGVTNAGTTTPYTYPANTHRLSAVGSVARSYDAVGNTTQIGGTARQLIYNDANRMSQVKAGSTVTMNYMINGKGEQVRKYIGAVSTYTVYDEASHWLGDYDTAAVPLQQAIWLDDLPVGLLVGATTIQKVDYLEADALGSARAVIDPLRNVAVWKWDLTGEVFGATVPNQDPDGDATAFVFGMRFAGQRYDAASGFSYNYQRDYESSTGRYVESDPVGLKGGVNTYLYGEDDPLRNTDPLGLFTYMCTRNIHKFWDWPIVGPLYHQYLCVGNSKTGYSCGGLGPTGSMIDSPGVVEPDKINSDRCPLVAPENQCLEKCIKQKMLSPPPNYSVDLTHGENCQTFADGILSECRASCKGKTK